MSAIEVTEAERPLVAAFVNALRAAPPLGAGAPVLEEAGVRAAQTVRARLAIETAVAGAVGAEEAARLAGAESTQAVYQRAKRLGLVAVDHDGRKLFPVWQFDPDRGGLRPVVADCLRVWRRAHVSAVTVLSWFTTPQAEIGGARPADLVDDPLAAGRLVMAARYAAAPFAH